MLVAVTGGTGFIGSHTVRTLLAAGHEVRLLIRDPLKLERVYGAHGIRIDDYIVGDVTKEASVSELLRGTDAVVHTAAVVALDAARAGEVRSTNRRGVELVVGGAAEAGLERLVYVSSAGALFSPGGAPIHADSPIGVTNTAYGESKAEAERYVRKLQESGAPILTVYPTGVVGPDDPGLTDPNRALCIILDIGAPLTTTGYQPVDVRDLAQLLSALLRSEQRTGRYVAAGEYLPWAELYERIESLLGRRLRKVPCPAPVLRSAGIVADAIKRVFPFDLPLTRESMMFATQWPTADATSSETDLGITFRHIDETLADTYRWLWRQGHLDARQIGRLAD